MDALAKERIQARKMGEMEKAMMTSYTLGKAFLKNLDIMIHEMKLSPHKEIRVVGEAKHKQRMKFHRDFHALFQGLNSYLSKEEIEEFQKKVDDLTSDIW